MGIGWYSARIRELEARLASAEHAASQMCIELAYVEAEQDEARDAIKQCISVTDEHKQAIAAKAAKGGGA